MEPEKYALRNSESLTFTSGIQVQKIGCLNADLQSDFVSTGVKAGGIQYEPVRPSPNRARVSTLSLGLETWVSHYSGQPIFDNPKFLESCAATCSVKIDSSTDIYVAVIYSNLNVNWTGTITNATCYCANSNTSNSEDLIKFSTLASPGSRNTTQLESDLCEGVTTGNAPLYAVEYPCAPKGDVISAPCGPGCLRDPSHTGTACCLPTKAEEEDEEDQVSEAATWVVVALVVIITIVAMAIMVRLFSSPGVGGDGAVGGPVSTAVNAPQEYRETRLRDEAEAESLSEALLLGFPSSSSGGPPPLARGFMVNPLAQLPGTTPDRRTEHTAVEMTTLSSPTTPRSSLSKKAKKEEAAKLVALAQDNEKCPVCQEVMVGSNAVLPCSHHMHKHCLREYINHHVRRYGNLKCPVCKGPLLGSDEDSNKKPKSGRLVVPSFKF